MSKHYDVICIGTGGAGNTAAFKLAAAGKKVLICDYKQFGGTCAISGCDPKKVMITAAEFADFHRRMASKGVVECDIRLSWKAMMAHKREFTGNHSEKLKYKYDKKGIDYISGFATFTGEKSLKISGEEFTFDMAFIGTGSKPLVLPFNGFENVCDNECFLNLDELPKRLLFIGGGYISVEFANIANAFGAETTIVQVDDRLVPSFEADIVDVMVESLRQKGINILTNGRVSSIEKLDGSYRVIVDTPDGPVVRDVDLVIHGAGRVANVDGLDAGKAGVELSRGGVVVNSFMQTTNPAIYAGGDCTDTEGYLLSPIAFMEGYIAAHNMVNGNSKEPDYLNTGTVMFNVPGISAVGYTEKQAADAGLDFEVKFERTDHWFTSFRTIEHFSAYKVLIEKGTGRILGAHIIGQHAEDIINLFVIAIKQDLKISDLKKILYAYPTASSDILHMVD
ncbi:FAD-dependent pyridine nucleotide-disulfide oxidoreductase [Denitrovibrio acetiphilus DSM 12809]|uniref:FAD-dependent pyridine nucleotide-disulfide oxidoreductase n=1 Tax=Denitrovibrio acetiphilus (strain DSM 12809 / NBRC 114555 / N2460) TaxID=522772 RepID=D4H0R6_DENA2|nr:NAD(P)/FAD-dependent oxidoreductase [Denitrovibrio acetiphilus]ADD68579.1 FAD-dependent pyridine nucleotide-disulfide oxidoreductase [Denitrovibrio acetiphilus DSM 12809]